MEPRRPLAEAPKGEVASRDPVTGEVWQRHPSLDAAAVRDALARARHAQPAWAARPLRDRVAMLRRFHRVLYERRAEVAEVVRREMAKPVVEALATEVAVALDFARFYAAHAHEVLHERRLTPRSAAHLRKRVRIVPEPFGVVGVISPWNYPFMLATGHVLPALVAGNAVLLKPSELTTATGLLLGALLHAAGVPEDVLQVLPGAGPTGRALTEAGCDKIFFTGSEATGRAIAHACAERLVPCVLELGGSDPAIVLDDAPLAQAAAGIVWGRFSNCGQTCVAPKRVFVVDAVYDRFVTALRAEMAALAVGATGAGAEMGPPVTPAQRQALAAQLDDARQLGAQVVAEVAPPLGEEARYLAPTVLAEVTPEMRVMSEETFGPLLPIVRVRDADEAVRRANASRFGLSASVWSADRARAEAVAMQLEVGTVVVNDVLVAAGMAEVPHGGVKSSGYGRSHGLAGLEECVRTRTVITDRLSGRPQPWWFRYTPALAGVVDEYIQLAHGRGLERLRAVPAIGPLLRRYGAR